MSQPQEIGVGRIPRFARGSDRQAVGFAVFDHLQAAGESLDELRVAPRGVDLYGRVEHVGGELEPDLVVATPSGAVKQHPDVSSSQLGQYRGNGDGTGDAGCVPVSAFVTRLRLDHLEAGGGQGSASREYHGVRRAGSEHTVFDRVEILFVGLPEVHRERVDLEPLVSQPMGDGAAIQSAGHRAADQGDVLLL